MSEDDHDLVARGPCLLDECLKQITEIVASGGTVEFCDDLFLAPDDHGPQAPARRARGPSKFKERDIVRALRAAKKAGIDARIDVAPDGALRIVPVNGDDAPSANQWDEHLDQLQAQIRSRLC
jgi:hypothetical protein